MKVYLVVFKDYAHGPKILEDSKVFLNKNQAQEFCDSLNAEPSDWWEDNEHYFETKVQYWMNMIDQACEEGLHKAIHSFAEKTENYSSNEKP